MENNYYDAMFEPKTLTLTRAEIDALNKHNEKVKRENIKAVLDEAEEMIRARYRTEDMQSSTSDDAVERGKFLHGRNVCESLIIELRKIRGRYEYEQR